MREMALSTSSPHPQNTLGLVLGAGGIRGCAHAGVYSVLAEAGIPIRAIVGASVGSMFGLAIAAGFSPERIAQAVRASTPLQIFRFYSGRLRSDRDNPIARLLLEAGEGKTFADLPVPFAVMGTDMESHEAIVIDEGPVLPAVQASIALPFVARPVELNGRMFVDGGLVETAPVHVARNMGADRVIAVCLGVNYTAPAYLRKRPWTRSVLERLGRQRGPVTHRIPDQVRFGCRLYAACYDPPPPAQGADVTIWPEFGNLSPNSLFGAMFCFEQGVRAAREALPEIESWLLHERTAAR